MADECDTLERAGVLSVRSRGNRFYFSLARRTELEAFVGGLPPVRHDWTAMLNIARELVAIEGRAEAATLKTLPVHVRTTLRLIEGDLDELDIEPPSENVQGADLWPAVRQLGVTHLGAWSIGHFPAEEGAVAEVRRRRPAVR